MVWFHAKPRLSATIGARREPSLRGVQAKVAAQATTAVVWGSPDLGTGLLREALEHALPSCDYLNYFEEFAAVAAFHFTNNWI